MDFGAGWGVVVITFLMTVVPGILRAVELRKLRDGKRPSDLQLVTAAIFVAAAAAWGLLVLFLKLFAVI